MDNIDVLASLKEEYGDVYLVEILGTEYTFRLLARDEYAAVDELDCSDEDKEDIVVSACLLDREITQEDLDISYAGIVSTLCSAILIASGLTVESAQEIGAFYYEEMMNPDNRIDAIILEAFPSITLEELETWTVKKTLKYFSRANWILSNIRGINVAELLKDNTKKIDYIDSNDRNY